MAGGLNRTILMVEDEEAIAKGMRLGLEREGYDVVHAISAEQALDLVRHQQPDLFLLDIRLPGMDGLALCQTLRRDGARQPIVMLTARDEEIDRVLGLELGADDYLVKPVSLRELAARVKAHLRRAYGDLAGQASPDTLTVGTIRVERAALRVFKDAEEILLTPVEFRLLLCLADHADIALSRSQIISRVWGESFVLEDERTVDVHIRHLREKLEPVPGDPQFIRTVRGYGYRFVMKP